MTTSPEVISSTPYDLAGWLVRADWHEEHGQPDEADVWRRRVRWAKILERNLVAVDGGGPRHVCDGLEAPWQLRVNRLGGTWREVEIMRFGVGGDEFLETWRCARFASGLARQKLAFGLVESAGRVEGILEKWPVKALNFLSDTPHNEGARVQAAQGLAEWLSHQKVPRVSAPVRMTVSGFGRLPAWFVPFGAASLLVITQIAGHFPGYAIISNFSIHTPAEAALWRGRLKPNSTLPPEAIDDVETWSEIQGPALYDQVVTMLHNDMLDGRQEGLAWEGMKPLPRSLYGVSGSGPFFGPWESYPE